MSDQQSSYRQIIRATSLFGGVQVFNIIIAIIRLKFIAVLLGPAGMGISGLLTSTTGLIGSITNFGLSASAVKNVSAANATGDSHRVATIVTVLRRLIWITGLLGTLVTLGFAPWLSELTFGNRDYTFAFIFISITLLLTQLNSGQLVMLQGMRKLNYLAKTNIGGSSLGLLVSVPLYYVWGVDGIVPAIIFSTFFALLISSYFASKVKIAKVDINKDIMKIEGIDMLRMGFMLSLSMLINLGVSYIVRVYINHQGGVEQVGLYTAGFAIINTYVGLVFTAMGTDYYPRLCAVAKDNEKAEQAINQQAEVALLILAPILAIFLVFINWVVILLYSTKFVAVNGMIHWAALGMFFKAVSWSIAYILLAKGASKIFFLNELIGNIYLLILNMIGYKLGGLDGLGISFLIGYVIYLAQVFFIANTKYAFTLKKAFCKIFGIQFLICFLCFGFSRELAAPFSYITGSILVVLSTIFSYKELDKRIGIKQLIKQQKKLNFKIK